MGKKLKLGFAMGGGVSLGTFSGSALTETIKQYMVYGKDENGEKYEEVVIDVFSGASAGAISLLVMLRGFFHYEDKLLQLVNLERFKDLTTKKEIKQRLKDDLALQFRRAFHLMDEKDKEKLIAVQATQELQRVTWVNETNIENIARLNDDKEKNSKIMLSKGSLLDRDFLVEDLASKVIYFDNNKIASSTNIKPAGPLADRVLYACTLTRIDPRVLKGEGFHEILKTDKPEEKKRKKDLNNLYDKILTDGASSKTHKDMRIFDITFDELNLNQINVKKRYPTRWINVHAGASIKNVENPGKNLWSLRSSKGNKNYRQENTWVEIVCTAMAAGSFPIAFEPVVLKRYLSELTESEKVKMSSKNEDFLRFSYIDGGTFNNEPISEAFKLAGFIDNLNVDEIQGETFDRKIIFVDPNIEEPTTMNNFDYLREYKLNPHRNKPTERTGFNKITQLIPPIISLLRNEGSVVELDKAKEVVNKFNLSDFLKKNYVTTIRDGFPLTFDKKPLDKDKSDELDEKIVQMRTQVQKYLDQDSGASMIPRTYGSLSLAFRKHIVNDINNPETDYFPSLRNHVKNLKACPGFNEFFKGKKPYSSHPEHFQDWLILLYFTLLELSQDLVEKNKLSKIIPIGPVTISGSGKVENLKLKGNDISRFYGFFSEGIREYDFNQGIFAAIEIFNFLNYKNSRTNIIGRQQINTIKGRFTENFESENTVNQKLFDVVEKRVFKELLKDNLIEITLDTKVRKNFFKNIWDALVIDRLTNGYLKLGFWFAKKGIERSILNRKSGDDYKEIPLEFRIKIKDEFKKYIITDDKNKRRISDIKPIFIKEDYEKEGSYYFIVILQYRFKETKGEWHNWEGKKIENLKIAKDRKFLLKDEIIHEITLPNHDFVKKTLEKGYYNYFKLNLADLKKPIGKNSWNKSREEASSLAGLILGKRRIKNS